MKKTINLFFVLAISLYFTSCCQQNGTQNEKTEKTVGTETEEHIAKGSLVLDNGKLWLANMETTTGINNMQKLMDAFTEKESVEAYAGLKTKLDAEFNTIIKECSMTGEPHNQLHNYLMPMGEMFDGIGSSELSTCKASFNELNKHLSEYAKYFK